jgi:hypothetical protein
LYWFYSNSSESKRVDLVLVGGIVIGLESRNQGAQTRRQNDQIARASSGRESMRNTGVHKDCRAGTGSFDPRFVIEMVNVKRGGAAAAPFVNPERHTGSGETRGLHGIHLIAPVLHNKKYLTQ